MILVLLALVIVCLYKSGWRALEKTGSRHDRLCSQMNRRYIVTSNNLTESFLCAVVVSIYFFDVVWVWVPVWLVNL